MNIANTVNKRIVFAILEVLLVAMVLMGLFRFQAGTAFLLFNEVILSIFYLAVLAFGIARVFNKDKTAFAILFGVLFLIIQFSVFVVFATENMLNVFQSMLVLMASLFGFVFFFRAFIGKRPVVGRVILSDKENAAVEIPFDIFSGIKEGKYVVATNKPYKKGELVEVHVSRKFFKKEPVAVIGKAKEQ